MIKMSDVAKIAKVSPATVARVVNNNGYVSEEKRKLVEEAVTKLGYVPNKVAQGLKNNKSTIIGHVMPYSYINPFFAQVGNAVDNAAEALGYHILSVVTQNDANKECVIIEDLVSRMAAGIIFTGKTSSGKESIEWLVKIGTPVVMIERPQNIIGIDKILINNEEGAFLATNHIISNGHRRIGFIGKESNEVVETERVEGYRKALINAKLEIQTNHLKFMPEYTTDYGYKAMKEIIEGTNPPEAFFIASDVFATGAMQYLYEKKLRIPEDISIVGYDCTLADVLSPPLTSVAFPMEEIGRIAIEMIVERKEKKRIASKAVTLSPILIDKGSVKLIK